METKNVFFAELLEVSNMSKFCIKIITIGGKRHNIAAHKQAEIMQFVCVILMKCLLTQEFVQYVMAISSHSSSLEASIRDILVTAWWKMLAVKTRANRTERVLSYEMFNQVVFKGNRRLYWWYPV